MNTQKVTIIRGLPSSGKSSKAKELLESSPNREMTFIIDKDYIRRMSGTYWIPEREPHIELIGNLLIVTLLKLGYDLIIDDLNLNDNKFNKLTKYIKQNVDVSELEITIIDLRNIPLETCINNDLLRGEFSVGEEVIRELYDEYIKDKKL